MSWRIKIRCFLTFKNPLSFYHRNYVTWKQVALNSIQDLKHGNDYMLLLCDEEDEDASSEEDATAQLTEAIHDSATRNGVKTESCEESKHGKIESISEFPTVMLLEKPFMKRNAFTLLRLLLQSFGLSLAISFSITMPALLQLIPLDFKLAFIKWLHPLSFILDPIVEIYHVLRKISGYIQGYDPTWLYVLAEQWFRELVAVIPFFPKLPARSISWNWEAPAGEIDTPQLAPQHRRILGILHRIIPNQWINLTLLWLLTAIPLFFFLCSRLSRQVIELMPEKAYLKRLHGLNKMMEACKGITVVAVKKNRFLDESSRQGQVLKAMRFLSRYGVILSFMLPVFLGAMFAFI